MCYKHTARIEIEPELIEFSHKSILPKMRTKGGRCTLLHEQGCKQLRIATSHSNKQNATLAPVRQLNL